MPPAARLNDPTMHGKPLGPGLGSANVLIGGQPAWRAGVDFHQCPLSDGSKPHIGGVVSIGSTTVFINGSPAVRQNDQITEAGAPNSIANGEPSVLIG